MEKLVVLDYSDTSVHVFDVDTEEAFEASDIGFKDSNCCFMFAEDLNIVFHKNPITDADIHR